MVISSPCLTDIKNWLVQSKRILSKRLLIYSMEGADDENPPPPPVVTPTQQAPHTVSTIKLPILKKDTNGQIKVLPPKTAKEILARERERKARITLLMAIPEDHLAKFHKMTDAKEMTKPGVDSLSFDDIYNNLRVFEIDVKGSTGSSSSAQNVAFVSSESTNSTNDVSTTYGATTSSRYNSQRENSSSYTNELMHSFFANQSSGPTIRINENWNRLMSLNGFEMASGHDFHKIEEVLQEDMEKVADDPQKTLKGKGIIDSRCSRHMTRNKAYLVEYQEFQGGSVVFGELHDFNLFSVSQMCDKKNKVLFTDTECLVLSPDFKLPDENQVLLRIPRQNNMYSFNLENIVPTRGLACLISKATVDESNKWHRRLGHVNFKNLNKLVKGNLVRGLPLKIFQNDHTCVACQKGKQHKASCKAKLVSSISQPLQLLHMDLFGPTSVRIINHNTYYLVITADFSRFSWVFFLRTKDETSGILKDFIRQIENQLNQKVKTIRCDNGTEFKNRDIIEFCGSKGIKREYSNARTLQQNRVAERKNRTLLPTQYGCLDHEYITDSMNYFVLLSPENKANKTAGPKEANNSAGTQDNNDAGNSKMEAEPAQEYFVLPLWSSYTSTIKSSEAKNGGEKPNGDIGLKTNEEPVDQAHQVFLEELERLKRQEKEANDAAETLRKEFAQDTEDLLLQAGAARASMLSYPDAIPKIHYIYPTTQILRDPKSAVQTRSKVNRFSGAHALIEPKKISQALEDESWVDAMQEELLQFKIQKVWILVDLPLGKKAIGTKYVYKNKKDERGVVVRNKARLIAQGHRQEEGINYNEVFAPVARIEVIRIFLAFASYMRFIVYQMDVKSAFLYGTINEEVYVSQPPGFIDPKFPNKVYKVVKALYGLHQALRALYATLSAFLEKSGYKRGTIDKTLFIKKDEKDIMLVQVYVDDIIFGSTKKSWCEEFEALMKSRFQMKILKKFDFMSVKTASTLIETQKPLVKDEEAADVDVSGHSKDFTSSCYEKDLFRLISWQCKKQTIVATSTTEAEYVAATNCYG
ncbi:putative ribonuclease H-like domain-containing protein [Tanacetum coccineum]